MLEKDDNWLMTSLIIAGVVAAVILMLTLAIWGAVICRQVRHKALFQGVHTHGPPSGHHHHYSPSPTNVFELDAVVQRQQNGVHSYNNHHQLGLSVNGSTTEPLLQRRPSRFGRSGRGYDPGDPDDRNVDEIDDDVVSRGVGGLIVAPGDEIPVPFGLSGVATATVPDEHPPPVPSGGVLIVPTEHERRQLGLVMMDDESDRASSKDSGTGTDSGANVSANGGL